MAERGNMVDAVRDVLIDPESSPDSMRIAKDMLLDLVTKHATELAPENFDAREVRHVDSAGPRFVVPRPVARAYFDALRASKEFVGRWHDEQVTDGTALWADYEDMTRVFLDGIEQLLEWGKTTLNPRRDG